MKGVLPLVTGHSGTQGVMPKIKSVWPLGTTSSKKLVKLVALVAHHVYVLVVLEDEMQKCVVLLYVHPNVKFCVWNVVLQFSVSQGRYS